ncbi:MAG: hypothetical protein ACRDRO_23400 [Pseudonocardiaceae bacterium]
MLDEVLPADVPVIPNHRLNTFLKRQHLGIALTCFDRVRREHPGGLPSHDIRSADEPLLEVD